MSKKPLITNPPKRRRWLRGAVMLAGILATLLVVVYFIITSEAFVKGFVLPKVGQALNADISVARVEVSTFRKLTLRNAKFTPKGAEPLVTCASVQVRYSLISILRGNIRVYKLIANAPTVTIVINADGTSNLDPLTQNSGPPSNSTNVSSGPVLDVRSLSLKNATYRQITHLKDGGDHVLEFTNVTLQAGGTMDLSKSDAITGNVRLTINALDVTSFYDWLARQSASRATNSAAEPEAVQLPFHNLVCDLKLNHLRLHELGLADVQIKAQLNGGHIVVKPCALTLDSAPLSLNGDIDLGVPGYRYDFVLAAQGFPLAPLRETFEPGTLGQIGGTLTANVQLKGGGFGGANLQKNLSGQFDVLGTNLNLSIANVRSPILNTIVDVVISIPDIIRNPTALIGSFVGHLFGERKKNGWVDALTAAPIDAIHVRGSAAGGKIFLTQVEVRSAAFLAEASGDIAIAPLLTNSTVQMPVSLAISRSLAKQADILAAHTPTNALYSPLPDFLTLKGTIGKPEADVSKIAVAELAAKTGVGVAKSLSTAVPDKAGSLIKSVGHALEDKSARTNATNSNLPPTTVTNQPEKKL